jgi:hypothetical protein
LKVPSLLLSVLYFKCVSPTILIIIPKKRRGIPSKMTHLEGANLTKSNLRGAYLSRADLREAKLMNAHIEGAKFSTSLNFI